MKLYFGKFLGFDIEEIPDSYLNWLLETNWFDKKYPQLVKPIDEELKYRQKWGIKVNEAGEKEEIKEKPAWDLPEED